ncbi:MAG: TraR/DksA family transcriptional regulator [Acidimicrobiales bacterium]
MTPDKAAKKAQASARSSPPRAVKTVTKGAPKPAAKKAQAKPAAPSKLTPIKAARTAKTVTHKSGAQGSSKVAAKKAPANKAPAKKAQAKPAAKAAQAKAAPSKASASKAAPARTNGKSAGGGTALAKEARRRRPARPPAGPYATDSKFLEEQRKALLSEHSVYQEQAEVLKAEADSLAQEREPGDVQFDEESGEGGTVTVDRERDLALSAQAAFAVEEIDAALGRIADKSYGQCERCQQPILKARLRAMPYARLCVACKSGGLSRR